MHIRVIAFSVALVLWAGFAAVALAQDEKFDTELFKLERLRKGTKTDLAEVDRRGERMLKEYLKPRDQAQIYYTLAHIHAQSGMSQPKQAQQYAVKALALPLEPEQRATLFVYRGDASQVREPGGQFAEKRAEAVVPYLEGLSEILKRNLPETLPNLPNVPELSVDPNDPHFAEMKKDHDEAVAARKIAEQQRALIPMRDVLKGQIVALYAQHPDATGELEKLAEQHLGNRKETEALLKAARDKLAKTPAPEPRAVIVYPSARPKRYYVIVTGGVLLFGVACYLLYRRLRVSRRLPPRTSA